MYNLIEEKIGFSLDGYLVLVIGAIAIYALVLISASPLWLGVILAIVLPGFFMIQPNEAKALILFGSYVGTVEKNGLRWTVPFFMRKRVSKRIRNFESSKLKVNDEHGNPIEIAAVVVWRVQNSADALFSVDNYESYVAIQSEAALRNLATSFPYDLHEGDTIALRSHPTEVSAKLVDELKSRLLQAGVEVQEARISHLAYAPEIASAMLQRQQASAVIAARQKIVEGAVGMVELAIKKLSDDEIIELDDERKAAMVSNLLVVLCGENNAQPVINSGSLYT